MKNQFYFMKLLTYRLFNTFLGKKILRLLKPLVYVKNLEKNNKEKKYPFIVAVTVDAESGHVKKNESRVWQGEKPEAFIGFYKGTENWRNKRRGYSAEGRQISYFCQSPTGQRLQGRKSRRSSVPPRAGDEENQG